MAQCSPAIARLDERTCWPSLKAGGRGLIVPVDGGHRREATRAASSVVARPIPEPRPVTNTTRSTAGGLTTGRSVKPMTSLRDRVAASKGAQPEHHATGGSRHGLQPARTDGDPRRRAVPQLV